MHPGADRRKGVRVFLYGDTRYVYRVEGGMPFSRVEPRIPSSLVLETEVLLFWREVYGVH